MAATPPDEEQQKSLLSEEEGVWVDTERKAKKSFPQIWQIFVYPIAVAAIFAMGAVSGYYWDDMDKHCSTYVSQPSPLLRDMGVKYHVQQYNGSFLHENIYRQDASPEVDEAWEALGTDYRPLRVPPEAAEEAGIAHDQVKINEKYGGGYPANLEGLHHLHCLNLLRKSLYYNYDYYHDLGQGAFVNDDYIVKRHVSHCMDIIRQQLMCTADTGVLGQIWVWPDGPKPFVDFNTKHKCKNYDAIRQWAHDNQLPEHPPQDYIQKQPEEGDRIYPEIP
ncbi:oxidase ustYa family protein [Aspergillus candidus]|uniref:Tat pathway signal sequence n=1 Tax=Aspergillus candidus TaxID=41067 RepID=A0A2I2F3E3_ASPCN|nr:hypothetical protein BDW47DRAFT_133767 [Aspergillus candidus]PLB35155.1 hypothetical protein BDW47DRAFT_133767 [Aspergillus candidus]